MNAIERTEARRRFALEQDIKLLIPIARELARKAKGKDINVGNLRRAVQNRGMVLGSTAPRYASVVYGQVMMRAGLVRTGRRVRTPRCLGGNLVATWRRAA